MSSLPTSFLFLTVYLGGSLREPDRSFALQAARIVSTWANPDSRRLFRARKSRLQCTAKQQTKAGPATSALVLGPRTWQGSVRCFVLSLGPLRPLLNNLSKQKKPTKRVLTSVSVDAFRGRRLVHNETETRSNNRGP